MAKIKINLTKIAQNFHRVNQICQNNNLELVVVTKCCCGNKRIIQHVIDAGAKIIAEFQPRNFAGIAREVKKIVLHSSASLFKQDFNCDFIYITDLNILEKYKQSSLSKQSQVIIPIEIGDMREGVPPEEIIPFLNQAVAKNIRITGLSANFGCLEAIEPKTDYFNTFIECVKKVEYQIGFTPTRLSVGGTSIWSLLGSDSLPREINQLRIGGGIFLGYDPALQVEIPELAQDTFVLEGEILEINTKKNTNQRRAVIDFGYASTLTAGLRSRMLSGVEIIGSSQDLTVVGITNTDIPLSTSDNIEFLLTYESLIRAMISPYIEKIYVY